MQVIMEISEDLFFYLDLIASFFGLIYILLATKQNNWCWPAAIISSTVYVFVFVFSKLYFDAILNFYYVAIAFYGFYNWKKISNSKEAKVSFSSKKFTSIWIAICAITSIALGYFAQKFTDAEFAYADAFTTIFSFYATWLITQKRIENWLFWIIINVVAIFMYYLKGLNFTVGLFTVYLVFAVYGFFTWRKEYLTLRA
jgi:nicotinamide mononucleotide transporter